MPDPSPLPPSLLSRLDTDASAALSSLATSDLPAATASMRTASQRRLLSLVPKALDTVDSLLTSTDPKIRLAAASKVLDTSPATAPETLAPTEPAIPLAAFTALLAGMSKVFGSTPPSHSPSPLAGGFAEATRLVSPEDPDA